MSSEELINRAIATNAAREDAKVRQWNEKPPSLRELSIPAGVAKVADENEKAAETLIKSASDMGNSGKADVGLELVAEAQKVLESQKAGLFCRRAGIGF